MSAENTELKSQVSEASKREQIKKYFSDGDFLSNFGALLLFGSIYFGYAYGLGAGVGVAAVSLIFFYLSTRNTPSDAQIDKWIEADIEILKNRSIQKCGIDASEIAGEPITILGLPNFPAIISSQMEFKAKVGSDKAVRMTPMGVLIIHLTASELFAYRADLDFCTGNPMNEETHEYFLKDLVSVTTTTRSMSIQLSAKEQIQTALAEVFEVTTSGGTAFSMTLNDPSLLKKYKGKVFALSKAELAIQPIREAIRRRKAA
jgi:hypothetical protein